MAKLMYSMPELMILMKAVVAAVRAVFFTLCFVLIALYVFGIGCRVLSVGTYMEEKYFASVPWAMHSLLLYGVAPDMARILLDAGNESLSLWMLLLAFYLVVGLTVMNMLVGILVEVVSVTASVEEEEMAASVLKDSLEPLLLSLNPAHRDHISRVDLETMLVNPKIAAVLKLVNVDPVGLAELVPFIFKTDSRQLSYSEFLKLLLSLRGSRSVTVKDIVDLRKFMVRELWDLEMKLADAMVPTASRSAFLSQVATDFALESMQSDRDDRQHPIPQQMVKFAEEDETVCYMGIDSLAPGCAGGGSASHSKTSTALASSTLAAVAELRKQVIAKAVTEAHTPEDSFFSVAPSSEGDYKNHSEPAMPKLAGSPAEPLDPLDEPREPLDEPGTRPESSNSILEVLS